MPTAAIYCRYSSDLQSESSIDAQARACREFCASRGYTVAGEYIDRAKSARTTQRPEFKRLMDDAHTGAFDVIVTHKLDRLSRSITDVLLIMRDLKEWGRQYVSATEQIDFTTPLGMMFLVILAWFAEWYLVNLRAEIGKGKHDRVTKGKANASTLPFGFTRNDAGVGAPDAGAPHALWAFNAYAGRMHGYREIAGELNGRGLTTKRGGPWNVENVREMIQNPYYAGWVTERGLLDQQTASGTRRRVPRAGRKLHRGQHEPIVSQELFDKCQEVRRERHRQEVGRKPKRLERYLFGGIAYCAHCGRKLTAGAWPDGRYANYTCIAHRLNLPCDATHRSVTQNILAQEAETKIAHLTLPGEIEQRAVELANGAQSHIDYERRHKALTAEKARVNNMYQKGFLEEGKWETELARITRELDSLQAALVRADVPGSIDQLHKFTELWAVATDTEKAIILKAIFERVEVNLSEGRISRWVARKDFADLVAE